MARDASSRPLSEAKLFWFVAGLLATAVLIGGGGVAYGLHNAMVLWVALAVLAASSSSFFAFWKEAPASFRWLCAASIALPLLQIAPLSPTIWQALPGRELVTQSLQAAGVEPGWRALAVNNARTLVAGLALLVPCALIIATHGIDRQRIQQLGWVIVGLGLMNFLWGIPQILSQGAIAIPYQENPMPGVLFGSFANRNSTAIFLITCLILALQLDLPAALARWTKVIRATVATVLVVGVILTQSRTGMALLAIPIGLSACRMMPAASSSANAKRIALGGISIVGLFSAAAVVIPGSRIETAFARFSEADGHRTQIWEDAIYSADRFWPIGAGMGSFDEVFQIDESLEHISPRTAGRAHNDYIELAIEGGALAIGLLALWILWTLWYIWKARRSDDRWIAWTGGAILLAIALQSLTDYPLRNLAMLSSAAMAAILLLRFSDHSAGTSS